MYNRLKLHQILLQTDFLHLQKLIEKLHNSNLLFQLKILEEKNKKNQLILNIEKF